jgi:hypothetical protein
LYININNSTWKSFYIEKDRVNVIRIGEEE